MTITKLGRIIIGLTAVLFVFPALGARTFPKVTNVSPNPAGTNEFWLTATNMVVTNIGGTNITADVYIDDPPGGGGATRGLPCPMIQLNVGMMVICHFQNKLTNNIEGASIHWHGIELDNDSDGTAITQDTILPGQTYLYRFIAPRAGLFWYHSHMLPGNTLFSGMYGPIVITSNIETSLITSNILPPSTYTFPLVLSDISFSNGVVGKIVSGTNYPLNTLIQLCENSALGLNSADQPFCGPAGVPGSTVLVNGYPPILAGTTNAPTTNSAPVFVVAAHSRVRLQTFCESTGRDFYLSLHYPSGTTGDTNLYRVGGQGGLLDNAILEGGKQGGFDFIYNEGSIVLGTGMRADMMFYPSGTNGQVIELLGNPLPSPWNLSGTSAPGDGLVNLPYNYPIAFFVVTNTGVTNAPLASGSPILAGTSAASVSLAGLTTNALTQPPPAEGILNGRITLENGFSANSATNHGYTPAGPNIGGYAAVALDGNSGDGAWLEVPHPPTALWARVGEVLQLAVINAVANSIHPYHLHGFSMQPLYIMSTNLATNLYTYPYTEYRDTIEIYPNTALVFRIKLTDRPKFADSATGGPVTVQTDALTGGAVGRWLMHCHIFLHTTIGMISELDVVSNTVNRLEGPAAGSDSAVLAGSLGTAWVASTNASWLHLTAANQSGTGSTNVVFTYDANSGATRTGAVNVAGETVAVTQAGATYVKAPGPLTGLVTNGISDPVAVAVDASGTVYFTDSGNNLIKEWTPSNNTVSTIASGISDAQGIAVDSLGNVYSSDYSAKVVKEWSATTHAVTVVPIGGLVNPSGLAVDGGGNIYVADPTANDVRAWFASNSNSIAIVSTGLNNPRGVAVDLAGNVYIADTGNNAVKEWIAANNAVVPLVITNLNSPWNVAVDVAGNVFISDGFNNAIKEWSPVTRTVTTITSGQFNDPTDVAVDGSGNLYIADFGNSAIKELPFGYVDPTAKNENANVNVDTLPDVLPQTQNLLPPFYPTSSASWLDINNANNGIVNFTTAVDLSGARNGTITVLGESVPVNQSGPAYTLGTSDLLVGPGAGSSTVVLGVIPSIALWGATANASWLHLPYSSGTGSGNVLFTYDANTGATRSGTLTIGGQTLVISQAGSPYIPAPGPVTPLATSTNGLVNPVNLALDSSGNVYFADSGNYTIKKWNMTNNTVTSLVTNLTDIPQGIAVDGSGNVYFAEFETGVIAEWVAASQTVVTAVSNLTDPAGIALDAAGNIYIADAGFGIYEWTVANSTLTPLVTTGLTSAYGVALDAAGNVYIADTYGNDIQEWFVASHTVTTLVSNNLSFPWNLSVDGCGNVYIADGDDNAIKEWVAANNTLISPIATGLSTPTDVAVDSSQNLYVADFDNSAIKGLPHAYVNPTPRTEQKSAGSDVLPVVLFTTEDLLPPFAPSVNQSWLSIGSIVNDAVTFSFTGNATTASRTGNITVLGQSIPVTQLGMVVPPVLSNAKMLANGAFQFNFTEVNTNATFTVISTTNIATPLTNWTVIGAASNISPGVLQFTDTNATNKTRFYMVRSP